MVPADISTVFEIMTTHKKLNEGKMHVHPVKLTLEEVYHGCLKKVTFQRRKVLLDESVESEDRQLVLDIKPGLPDGTRFVFEGFAPFAPSSVDKSVRSASESCGQLWFGEHEETLENWNCQILFRNLVLGYRLWQIV